MSWEQAKVDAEKWLQSLGALSQVKGRYLDLRDKGATLAVTGGYRIMVLRAAERLVTKRGGTVSLPE